MTTKTTKTTTNKNAFLEITAENIQQRFNFKSVKVVSTPTRVTITATLSKIDDYKLYDLNKEIVSSINYSVDEEKAINSAFSELYIHSHSAIYAVKNSACYFKASENPDNKGITTVEMTYINPFAINQNDNASNKDNKKAKADAEKKAFIESAKKADLLGLITSLSVVNTEYDDNKELTKLFVKTNIHSDYVNFVKYVDFVELLTNDYSAESNEKKTINKLLQSFATTYKNTTKDIATAMTHSNIQICVKTDEKHYFTLKKFTISIFDIVKIDALTELHTALKSNAFNNKNNPVLDSLNSLIKELKDKIQKTVDSDIKPVYICDREFKRMLMKCTLRAGKKHCTYNKSNVEAFISGYVIASYNNRVKQFVSELKATK